jgi:lysophospholipid acyltransferase (LPLAT)-like uncharacterized protein
MRFPRRALDNSLTQGVLAWLAAGYLRFVHRSTRWQRIGFEEAERLATTNGRTAAIACFWHGRMLMMPFARIPRYAYTMMISSHRDGRLIARAVGLLGIDTAAGSSTRGGTMATLACIERLRRGHAIVCMTPDGPRGPRMQASVGAVEMARISGVTLVPVSYGVTRRRVLSSWDRFLLPLPFGRGVLIAGEPIEAAALDTETARRLLEQRLNAISAEADRLSGHAPIEPAAVPGERRPALRRTPA